MYYTAIIFISILSMIIIQIPIFKSNTLDKHKKQLFHLLFSCIAIAALCEWLGAYLQEMGSSTRLLHFIVKIIELSLVPCIGVLFGWIVEEVGKREASILLGAHALLEIISSYNGCIYMIDNHSVYTHGRFYWIYILALILSAIYTVYIILKNVRKYQYNGIGYYFAVIFFLLGGVTIQFINSEIKVDYIILALSSIMLYVFTLEMIQQTDELTQLINRRGYENYISHIDKPSIIIFFDIDQFKKINDVYGHNFGDECIRHTGNAIKNVYARYGKCFRFGGDEFCAVLTKLDLDIEQLNQRFFNTVNELRSNDSKMPYISLGYVSYHPLEDNIIEKIEEADKMMYDYKEKQKIHKDNL